MAKTPITLYRYGARLTGGDWTKYSSAGTDPGGPAANVDTVHPGEMMQINSGFVVRDSGALQNNEIQVDSNSVSMHASDDAAATGYPSSYNGTTLATEAQAFIRTIGGFAAYTVTFSETTKLFTFTDPSTAHVLNWGATDETKLAADLFGFDQVDTASALSHVSDYAVFAVDAHWITYQTATTGGAPTIAAIMLYDHKLDAGDKITLYGHAAFVGPDYLKLNVSPLFKETQSASTSGINRMHVWRPATAANYWTVLITRATAAKATSKTRIGCLMAWEDKAYSGTRNFAAPWRMKPNTPGSIGTPELGGGSFVYDRRSSFISALPFRDWTHAAALAFQQLITKFGQEAYLWDLDPDDPREDTVIWGRFAQYDDAGHRGPDHTTDFDVSIQQIPMHARGT